MKSCLFSAMVFRLFPPSSIILARFPAGAEGPSRGSPAAAASSNPAPSAEAAEAARGGHRRAPPMVRLVFCLASPPATSSRLVEHAKLTQRVEAGEEPPRPGTGWTGRKGECHWPNASVSIDGPAGVSGPWRGQGSLGVRWAAAPREGFHRLEESLGLWSRRSLRSAEPSSPAQPECPSPTLGLGL